MKKIIKKILYQKNKKLSHLSHEVNEFSKIQIGKQELKDYFEQKLSEETQKLQIDANLQQWIFESMPTLTFPEFQNVCNDVIDSINKEKITVKNEVFLMQKNPVSKNPQAFPNDADLLPIRINLNLKP